MGLRTSDTVSGGAMVESSMRRFKTAMASRDHGLMMKVHHLSPLSMYEASPDEIKNFRGMSI